MAAALLAQARLQGLVRALGAPEGQQLVPLQNRQEKEEEEEVVFSIPCDVGLTSPCINATARPRAW
eukprot:135608-Pyramimonas_sp.AAC.1